MAKENGGPAFPIGATPEEWGNGMTLRDYFAAKVLQGAAASEDAAGMSWAAISESAYVAADAMLAERSKP